MNVPDNLLRCACGTPVMRFEGGKIVLEVRHHGEKHTAVIDLEKREVEFQLTGERVSAICRF
jgi:hypothetical protein